MDYESLQKQRMESAEKLRRFLEKAEMRKVTAKHLPYLCDLCDRQYATLDGFTYEAGAFSFCPVCSNKENK